MKSTRYIVLFLAIIFFFNIVTALMVLAQENSADKNIFLDDTAHIQAVPPLGEFARSSISIGLVVEDLNKSIDFYTKVIGMIQGRELSIDSEKAKRMGISESESFDIKFLKLENIENATELKIMSFGKKSNVTNQKYIPESNGVRYITIFVKSMRPMLERIREYEVKTLGETPTMLDETRQIVLMQDPDGIFVEVIGTE